MEIFVTRKMTNLLRSTFFAQNMSSWESKRLTVLRDLKKNRQSLGNLLTKNTKYLDCHYLFLCIKTYLGQKIGQN